MESEIQNVVDSLLTRRPVNDLIRKYLAYLKHINKFEPLVIYDIGSSLGAFTKLCHLLHKDSKIYLFEADDVFEKEYNGEDYYIVCLGAENDKEVNFYNSPKYNDNNDVNSLYKCTSLNDDFKVLKTRTLDSIVSEKSLRYPDLIKINCNGSELDIIKGGVDTIKKCKYLIVKMQTISFYEGAPLFNEVVKCFEDLDLEFEIIQILDPFGNGLVDYVFKNKNV